MINRPISILKYFIFGFFKVVLYILRCGRRKRAPVDDSLPTDIVIGDSRNDGANFQPFPQSSAMSNGYEMTSPTYHVQESTRHPYQSQLDTEPSPPYEEDQSEMQSWGEWDQQEPNCQEDVGSPENHIAQNSKEPPAEEEVDFFADMEPTVKVKKIYVKKKHNEVTKDHSAKFSINQDLDFGAKLDLEEEWADDDGNDDAGWEDDDIAVEIDPSQVAKEARQLRKQERMLRSEEQKSRNIKESGIRTKKSKLGTKVS